MSAERHLLATIAALWDESTDVNPLPLIGQLVEAWGVEAEAHVNDPAARAPGPEQNLWLLGQWRDIAAAEPGLVRLGAAEAVRMFTAKALDEDVAV